MGDLNVKVRSDIILHRYVMGKYSGERNDNGGRFVDFCSCSSTELTKRSVVVVYLGLNVASATSRKVRGIPTSKFNISRLYDPSVA